jgi:tRNA (cytidine/uridine-2'-O-)-methyltransferase
LESVLSLRIALYEPDIPQNTGTILRMAACLGVNVDVIGPCGFVWGGKQMRRAGMDYLDDVNVVHHLSWETFQTIYLEKRTVLLTTKTKSLYTDFKFHKNDILIMGSESSGVPNSIHENVNARVKIPLKDGLRSFNLAIASAIVLGEALRQLKSFPLSNSLELK